MLLCPVRNCHQPLAPHPARLVCPRNHSFDISRRGYINLLQPQDKRSAQPGDPAPVIAARRRLHDRGISQPFLDTIAALLPTQLSAPILDAGCGDGYFLANLPQSQSVPAYGIDISTPAIDAAARRYPNRHWIVANADRFIPLAPHSCAAILSIAARRNPTEFHRILQPASRLLIAVPSPLDIAEIRGPGRDRTTVVIAEFHPLFRLLSQQQITTRAGLDATAVEDVRLSIYRPLQNTPPTPATITFSLDFLLFEPV